MRLGLAVLLALGLSAPVGAGPVLQVETTAPAPKDNDPKRPSWPVAARLIGPTDRYIHPILGGIQPFTRLEVDAVACGTCAPGLAQAAVLLPDTLVFEDVAPRLWDVTGDGRPEIVVVETHLNRGARLVVWTLSDTGSALKRLAATPFIGQPQRWLAPVGAADFDGDGQIELAYVDRPHLVRDLVLVRLQNGALREIVRRPGFSSHRIGDRQITSALQTCEDGTVALLLPDADWSRVMAVRLAADALQVQDMGAMSPNALSRAAARVCG